MKIIISPAKSLDFEAKAITSLYSTSQFLEQSAKLNKELKAISNSKLSKLMGISPALAELNYKRNQTWELPFTPHNAKQAVYTFNGEVYRGIDINSLDTDKLPILQNTLRILSGLYGILKPLDLIQPYRLEMGTRIKVERTENLYKFWGDKISNSLNDEMSDDELFVNLASSEYFKVINKKILKVPIITPVFKNLKNGQYKTIMTFAKKARGLMVRYIIDNNITTIDGLKEFDLNGYMFQQELSTNTELVFRD